MGTSSGRGIAAPFVPRALAAAVGLASLASATAASADAPRGDVPDIRVMGAQVRESESLKFTAPLLDTPRSVTVISSTLLEQRGATSLVEALRNAPGISFNAGEGGQPAGDNLKIRGFDAGSEVFIDGIRDAGSQTRDIFALEQVEVVKGPSSTFAGRGSAGGAVNLVTRSAHLENSLGGTLGGGTDDFRRITVDANRQIGDAAAVRVNLLEHEGGVPGRDGVDYDHEGFLAALGLGLESDWRLHLDHYHYRTDDVPDYSFPYGRNAANSAPEGEPVVIDRDNFYGVLNRDFQRTAADVTTARFEQDLGASLLLRSTTRIGRTRNDYIVTNPDDGRGNVPNGFVLRNAKSRDSVTRTLANQTELAATVRFAGMDHSYVVGVEYLQEDMFNRNYRVTGAFASNAVSDFADSCSAPGAAGAASGFNCTTLANPDPDDPWTGTIARSPNYTDVRATSISAYALDTITLSDRWLLNLGMRHDDFEIEQATQAGRIEQQDAFWNYQFGVVYKPLHSGSIYLSAATSSSPAGSTLGDGTENLSDGNDGLDPERTRSLELGTKWLLLDDRLSVEAALFRAEKDNARVAVEPGRGAPQDTIGEQRVDGFEIAVNGRVTDRWRVLASYSWLGSSIEDDGPIEHTEGNVFPNTPEHSASLWTTYALTSTIQVGAGAFHVGRRYGDAENTIYVDAYTRWDAMAAWQATEHLAVQLNVQNLTDETYFDRPYRAHYAAIGPARQIQLSATWEL